KGLNTGVIRHNDKFIALALKVKSLRNKETLLFFPVLALRDLLEDSLAPDWNKVIDGQINLRDAVNGTISYTNEAGKIYQLKPDP
ncbi:YjeJ family protein, partial [Salmonella enterica subsp. enterica serovar Kentucky]|nr:YjeJ family protein [Salmonella enterica subsp. enterica serovar Kentucky]